MLAFKSIRTYGPILVIGGLDCSVSGRNTGGSKETAGLIFITSLKDSDLGEVGLRRLICPQICVIQRCL